MNGPKKITLIPDEEHRGLEIGRKQREFFECIAHIPPSHTVPKWPPTIRGRIVQRIRPARFEKGNR